MRLRFHPTVGEFVSAAGPLYRRDPIGHTVELTLLRTGALRGDEPPLLLTVWDGDQLAGAAMQTPPMPLLCSGLPLGVVGAVVLDLIRVLRHLGGVRGPRDIAEAFAQQWRSLTGDAIETDSGERLFRLGTLRRPDGVEGAPRIADLHDAADLAVLIDLQCGFAAEAFGHEPDPAKARAAVDNAVAANDAFLLWECGDDVVAMAGVRSPAHGVSRIGPVFTPPGHRRRGYGSAVTAAAADQADGAGARDVVLFTDLANPVSNSIYRRLGFEPVSDGVRVLFA